jgi:hypothetical protein|tara:strand:- start:257 stop:457 length:201 start_codon:yes stop_codon:yes gene_type:complete
MFWKKKETEVGEETQKNFVVKIKQDRNKDWICESIRVQANDISEVKERLDEVVEIVETKLNNMNGE